MKHIFYVSALLTTLSFNSCGVKEVIKTVKMYNSTQGAVPFVRSNLADTISFRINKAGWILLPITITAGTKTWSGEFFYDSGAPTLLSDSFLFGYFEAQPARGIFTATAKTVNGSYKKELNITGPATIAVGKSSFSYKHLMSESKSISAEDTIYGILGPNNFYKQTVLIDFTNNTFIISPDQFVTSDWNQAKIDFVGLAHSPLLKSVSIGGVPNSDWLMDTGNPSDLLIRGDVGAFKKATSSTFSAYQIATEARNRDAAGIMSDSINYKRQSTEFNGSATTRFNLSFSHRKGGKHKTDNNMGLGFMRKVFSRVVFDGPAKKFYYQLAPVVTSSSDSGILREVNLNGTNPDSVFVREIATASTWFKQGLRADHFITAVNGKPVSYWLERLDEFRKTEYESFEFVDNGVRRTIYK